MESGRHSLALTGYLTAHETKQEVEGSCLGAVRPRGPRSAGIKAGGSWWKFQAVVRKFQLYRWLHSGNRMDWLLG